MLESDCTHCTVTEDVCSQLDTSVHNSDHDSHSSREYTTTTSIA